MAKGRTAKQSRKNLAREQKNTKAAMGMIFFLAMAFLLFTSLLGDKSLFQLHKLQLEREWWGQENSRQAEENRILERKILAARDDLFIVEKIAREDLGLVKKNEVVYLFDPGKIRKPEESIPEIR